MNLHIHIKTIPHDKQRYNTVGDWYFSKDGTLQVRVSKFDDDMEVAIALHEVIEAILCRTNVVPETAIDYWDKSWKGTGEPGDNRKAPYHREHVTASICERAIAQLLEIDWNEYSRVIDSL